MSKKSKKNKQEIFRTEMASFVMAFLNRYHGETAELYKRYLNRYMNWALENDVDPWRATRIDLETYAREMLESGFSPATIRTAMSPVRSIFKLAHADGMIERNPGLLMWMPKVKRDPSGFKWLDRVELSRWIKIGSTLTPRHHAVAVLAGVLALRASEIANLDVNSWRNFQDGHQVLKFVGKGGKPATIPLDVPVLRALAAVAGDRTAGPLIPQKNGGYISRHGITSLVHTICRHAGTKLLTPHALRRSCITAALDMGISVRDVKALARHVNVETTMLYDRNGFSLDRHAAHSLSSWLAA